MNIQKSSRRALTDSIAPDRSSLDAMAAAMLAALDERRQVAPLRDKLDLASAYRVAAVVRRLREGRGERVVGRKVGFTNTTIWDEYGVGAPIWGPIYDSTLRQLDDGDGAFDLSAMVEPRIEPEVAFGLARAPEPDMDERALLTCVEWVAHGFEVVQSLFRDWRFGAGDAVAAFGLHGALLLGEKVAIAPAERDGWHGRLGSFTVALLRDGSIVDRGRAANVLGGGPLAALRHLVAVLAADDGSPRLAPGEVVTTGTLTRALPVAPGEHWSTKPDGLGLGGVCVRFS